MALPAGSYLIRANPAATTLTFQELAAHLSRAVKTLTVAGQGASRKAVTSDWERPTLEGP
jgi:RNase P protein component